MAIRIDKLHLPAVRKNLIKVSWSLFAEIEQNCQHLTRHPVDLAEPRGETPG